MIVGVPIWGLRAVLTVVFLPVSVARELGKPIQMTNVGTGHDVVAAPNARALNRVCVDGKFIPDLEYR